SLAKQRGGRVVVQCQAAILPLLAGCPGIDVRLAQDATLPDFDVHVPLLSLPHILGTRLDNIPAEVPYLFADEALVKKWGKELTGSGFKIGLTWQGTKTHKGDRFRSIPLARFAPLAEVEGVE